MVVYGRNAVREALRGRRRVHAVWATQGAGREPWVPKDAHRATAEEIEALCGSDGHQGVCAEADPFPYAGAAELLARRDPLLVALDEVTDPQNLGAVARSADSGQAPISDCQTSCSVAPSRWPWRAAAAAQRTTCSPHCTGC